jgi:FtsH-binding integral membrane protein
MLLVPSLDRSSVAIKKWLLFSLAGAGISFLTAIFLHVPLGKTLVAIGLAALLIFSGFLLRSFGKHEEEGGPSNERQGAHDGSM